MSGCLSLPFRLLGLLLLVALGWVAWSYRDDIRRKVHEWTADGRPPVESGTPVAGRAGSAARQLEGLLGGRADSVVLSPSDVASLLDSLARAAAPGAVDSMKVTLGADEMTLRARIDTRALAVPLGVLGGVVRDHETVEAGGRVTFRQPGRLEWEVDRVRVRGIPVPAEVYERMLRRFSAIPDGRVVALPIPRSVTGLRVSPAGVTLYGAGR